jgi:hypothetical protein
MIESIVLAGVLASGPQLPEPIQKGEKYHPSPVSLYQGREYVKRHNTYRGAYQFSKALKNGAAWMMQKSMRRNGVSAKQAKRIRKELQAHPMNQWHPYWQDRAFWTIWDHGDGRFHWAHTVPGTACFPE